MPYQLRTMSTPARILITMAAATAVAVAGVAVVSADPPRSLTEVQETVDELHAEAAEANERHNIAVDDLDTAERRLVRAEGDVERQTSRLQQITTEVGGFAAAAYRAGGLDPTLQALFAENPDEFLSQVSVGDAFASQQVENLAAVAAERLDLEQKRLTFDDQLDRVSVIEETLSEERVKVESLLSEQEALLDRLTAEQQARLDAQRERERQAAQEAREEAAHRISRGDADPAAELATSESAPTVSGRAADAVQAALSKVGNAYVYATAGPDTFDCSGLTSWAWGQAGVSLSRSSSAQFGQGTSVASSELQPGDLLFYGSPISHVAMYIGDGTVVHAANPRSGVTTAPAMQAGGSSKPFVGAKRPG